jgi:hypothetical protein
VDDVAPHEAEVPTQVRKCGVKAAESLFSSLIAAQGLTLVHLSAQLKHFGGIRWLLNLSTSEGYGGWYM